MNENNSPSSKNGIRPIALIIFWIIGLAVIYALYISSKDWSWENAAQFGDMWGGVNAIFSGTAIIAMTSSIMLQRKDLSAQRQAIDLQRKEMEMTRAELAKSADAHSATVEHMSEQATIMKTSVCLPEIDRKLESIYDLLTNSLAIAGKSTPIKIALSEINIQQTKQFVENKITQYQQQLDQAPSAKINFYKKHLNDSKHTLNCIKEVQHLNSMKEDMFKLLLKKS